MKNPVLAATRAALDAKQAALEALVAPGGVAIKRAMTTAEHFAFEALDVERRALQRQVVALEGVADREAGLDFAGPLYLRGEPHVYDSMSPNSYLLDMAHIAASGVDTTSAAHAPAARQRLQRHAQEVVVEARTNKRVARHLAGFHADKRRKGAIGEFEQRVNPNATVAGQGGEFVPPLWDEALLATFLRPGRVCANRVTNLPLPPGVGVINIPKITLGALTGIQGANAGPVQSRDITTTSVSAAVNTIAGEEDISLQLLEQSPLSMDVLVWADLQADLDAQLDSQILVGTGANGQHLGIFNLPSTGTPIVNSANASAITVGSAVFHDATTTGTQYRSILKGISQIESLTFAALPPTAIWVHPRRSNSWAYATDSLNRPLFVSATNGKFNAVGTNEANPVPEGVAGELAGLPVIKDANMPTTMHGTATTGGTADAIVVLNEATPLLYEGTTRLRALPEILSGTLQIRFQLYCYSAFLPSRFPTSAALLTGDTGCAAPGF